MIKRKTLFAWFVLIALVVALVVYMGLPLLADTGTGASTAEVTLLERILDRYGVAIAITIYFAYKDWRLSNMLVNLLGEFRAVLSRFAEALDDWRPAV